MKTSYGERDYTYGTAMLTLRTAIGLTQEGLAKHLGVSRQAVGKWEAGSMYPKAEHLKELIELAVEHRAFPKGGEVEEIRTLWKVSRQKHSLDERWLSLLLSQQQNAKPLLDEVSSPKAISGVPVSVGPVSEPEAGKDQAMLVRHNLPFPPNPFFTGRESELLQLQRCFEYSARIAITQPVSVSGLGGIGKTQLALEYAHRCSLHLYRYVFWVNASNKASLEVSYLSLAHLLQLPEQQEREVERIVQAVKSWLEQESRWLLIFDNADDLEMACSALPTRPRGHILLTTRSQIVGNLATLLQVEALSPQEGLLFLLRRSGILRPRSEPESLPADLLCEAGALVELLGGHPLALDQAGAYLEETREPSAQATGASFAEYRQLYQQQRLLLLQRRGLLGSEHPETVATVLEISLQKVYELHPKCAEVLAFCAFLHPDAIPEELLRKAPSLDLDQLQFNEVIQALRRYSLIKRDSEKQVLSLHRLVQSVIRDRMDLQTFRHWTDSVLQAVNDAFPVVTFEQWMRCERYLSHALASVSWIEQEAVLFPQAVQLLEKAGAYLQERGQYKQAEPLLVRAIALREQHLLAEHSDTARSLNSLANLYWHQSKYEQAEPLYQQALAIFEQYLGAEHLDTAMCLDDLGVLYQHRGKYKQAESLFQRVLTIREQHLGVSHPDTAKCLNNLAGLYYAQGRYEQAEPLWMRALAIREQHLGAEHPDTAKCLNNLAGLYYIQGNYEQAEPLFQRAIATWERHLGVNHPFTAACLGNLAQVYLQQGKYEQAESLFQRSIATLEQQLGANHLFIVNILAGWAELARHQGQYEQAEALYQRALSTCEQHLGAKHPLTVRVLRGLAELSKRS
jgi:tetratricopeptide (TPR) repeat protein/transcriptional regulator with XRE-family HTH domain